jgi:hypothetical protein
VLINGLLNPVPAQSRCGGERQGFSSSAVHLPFSAAHVGPIVSLTSRGSGRRYIQERKVKPRRTTPTFWLAMVLLARFFNWRDALIIVKPETFLRWHCNAFRRFWRWKSSKPGRPPLPLCVRELVRKMAREKTTWGEERIADELKLNGHTTFHVLYVFVAMEIGTRRILHCNIAGRQQNGLSAASGDPCRRASYRIVIQDSGLHLLAPTRPCTGGLRSARAENASSKLSLLAWDALGQNPSRQMNCK